MGNVTATSVLHLFVPADRSERFAKAAAAGPDAVIVDLEDAVAPENKEAARSRLAAGLSSIPADMPVFLRVNAAGTAWHADDLAVAKSLRLGAVILPKAENPGDLRHVVATCGCPVIALIETALGIHRATALAQASSRIAFGSIDFAADMAMSHSRLSLLAARSALVMAARLAGQAGPIDGVTTAIGDEELIVDDCMHAVELGFSGKLLIHPAQVAPARKGFAPSLTDVEWAGRVLSAASQRGVSSVDGAMVDAPVIRRAEQIMLRQRHSQGLEA